MKREEIESILEDIHCRGFAFNLSMLMPASNSITAKMLKESDPETR